ncbi:EAL domain-containing protein [Methylomonas koyamae]|uniref:EAL domain-containing protein n=1 Tax=Methylomonas koyamae TaxID=702114 RepID=UPI00164241B1|nr:EAL domain-containing protein [Methylomonas koyamae]
MSGSENLLRPANLAAPAPQARQIGVARPLHFAASIAMLAAAIFIGGWLGMKLVIPPGYSSPLWPPAGIALAALLIWGRRLWPGIWLGAVLNELTAAANFSGQLNSTAVAAAMLIAGGSTLQAVVASGLSERYLRPGLPKLETPGRILTFFVLVGPLVCVTAPSIGIGALYGLQLMPGDEVQNSWRNWWIGDSLGVMVIAPLLFCAFGRPHALWRARRLSVALPLLGTLLALVLVFTQVFRAEQTRIQQTFDNRAAAVETLLAEYTTHVVDSSLALRDVFLASSDISREQFSGFARGILERHPEIQALEWLPRIRHPQRAGFEAKLRQEGYAGFRITERDPSGRSVPAGERAEYFPVAYVEPMAGNERSFGLDSVSNPLSKQAKDAARASGKPTASAGLSLVQADGAVPGVLVSIPVFKMAAAAADSDFIGFVSAVIVPARMLEVVTQGLNTQSLDISIEDTAGNGVYTELFAKRLPSTMRQNYALQDWQRVFKFVDRDWRVTIMPSSQFINEQGSSVLWVTLLGGLCFTSLLNIMLLIVSGRTAAVEALVEQRTRDLETAVSEQKAAAQQARESELKLRTIVDSQPESVKLLARDGRLLQMNPAGLDMIEADSLQQAQNCRLEDLVGAKYRDQFKKLIRRVFAGASGTLEFEITGLRGGQRWLDTHAVPMRDADGNITALLGLSRDITERKLAEDDLKLAARVFSEAHEGILITDAEANIIDVNPTFCEITGYSRDEMVGKKPNILQSGKYGPEFYAEMWRDLQQQQHWRGELWNRKKNGDLYAEWLTISALCDSDGRITHYIGLFSDVTQAKQQQQLLELVAHYDPLTRLPNRILFADRLSQAIAHSKREKSLLAICFLDLDGFKPVNDLFGHDIGDRVLVEVAERIKNTIREEDSVSRHGGDEFALLLRDIDTLEQCEQAILRIHQAISEPFSVDGQQITVGASSGYTLYPLDDADPDGLLRHADHAMYQAKLAGKNRCQLFDATQDQQIMHRHQQLRDIEAAFVNGEMCLYYQPKVDIKRGQVAGVEALIRWLSPQRGMVPPLEFLPAIASTDLEIRIGNWVIEQACRDLAAWQALGLKLEVSVNISSYHLLWPGIQEHIAGILRQHPEIRAQSLQLEILESTALDDLSAVNRIIKNCREQLGISVALDDFGTGYSSLTHLRHLSVDTVKIDQTFVRDMLDDPDDYAIIDSVIDLSQAFNRKVVAEGVENQDQGVVLLLLGCRLLQGYAIARPMPAAQIADWVAAYRPFADWDFYANAELTPEQTMIAIRRCDARQWLQRVRDCLFAAGQQPVPAWPIMDRQRTHLGRWLRQARQERQHAEDWLERLLQLQQNLHSQADRLQGHYDAGELAAAQTGFADLQAVQREIDESLILYTQLP